MPPPILVVNHFFAFQTVSQLAQNGWGVCVGGLGEVRQFLSTVELASQLFIHYILFSCSCKMAHFLHYQANKHFNILLNLPPPGVFVADRGPADSTCSAECSIGGWSGCDGSAAVTVPLQSHLHYAPLSTGNHTTGSYNW